MPLPVELAGITIQVIDSAGADGFAGMVFWSGGQGNWLIRKFVAIGSARGIFRTPASEFETTIEIVPSAPNLFTANANASGAPAANGIFIAADGTRSSFPAFQCGPVLGISVPKPIDLGSPDDITVVSFFGSGFGHYQTGEIVSESSTIGLLGTAPQRKFAELDQANGQLMEDLRRAGDFEASISFDDGVGELRGRAPHG